MRAQSVLVSRPLMLPSLLALSLTDRCIFDSSVFSSHREVAEGKSMTVSPEVRPVRQTEGREMEFSKTSLSHDSPFIQFVRTVEKVCKTQRIRTEAADTHCSGH